MRHALVPVLLSVPRLSHCLGLLALKQRKRSLRTDERCDSMSSLPKENRTADRQNSLQAASDRGHEKVVELLLGKGADVNAQGGHFGNALQAASERGHEKVVGL